MIFEELKLEELRALTVGQITAKIVQELNRMTKKQICEFIWGIKNTPAEEVKLTSTLKSDDGPDGQITRIEETQNILGVKLGSRKTDWSYYPTGEVDTIDITEFDDQDKVVSQKGIKHFVDGRQPISTG